MGWFMTRQTSRRCGRTNWMSAPGERACDERGARVDGVGVGRTLEQMETFVVQTACRTRVSGVEERAGGRAFLGDRDEQSALECFCV